MSKGDITVINQITITKYSSVRIAVFGICRWTSCDKQRLMRNVERHQSAHNPRPLVVHKEFKPEEITETLIVHQGFERGNLGEISDFKLADFRGSALPHFSEPEATRYRRYYVIERYESGSRCPWGNSRWVTGENGKLKMLDEDWDTSG